MSYYKELKLEYEVENMSLENMFIHIDNREEVSTEGLSFKKY